MKKSNCSFVIFILFVILLIFFICIHKNLDYERFWVSIVRSAKSFAIAIILFLILYSKPGRIDESFLSNFPRFLG